MSKQEVASGAPWKSNAELTHMALSVVAHGHSIAGLSDDDVRVLYERVVIEPGKIQLDHAYNDAL